MNSAEGNVGQDAANTWTDNVQPMVRMILQTMVEFGKPYGQNYIAQFLTANKFLMFRQDNHRQIESYGKLRNRNLEDVVCMVHYLIDQGFITTNEPEHLTVEVSETGLQWLAAPYEIMAARQNVRFSALERYLRDSLRHHRRDVAARLQVKSWEIMNDFTMDRIVLGKPLDIDTLSRTPGMNTLRCERFGAGIVKTVQDVIEHFEEYTRANLMVRIKGGSYPRVKSLFQQNVTIPEIAQVCGIKMTTVCSYLRDLHNANQVDLIPWIERNINSKSLYKGVEYFERVRRPTLSEANNTLGLDYSTLLFCWIYAKDKRMQQEEARLMAS